jgi:ACS family tartrate transporter-like MFS transporter
LGILVLKFLTSRPGEATWLNSEERAWLGKVSLRGGEVRTDPTVSIWTVMRDPQLILFALAYSGLMMGLTANFFFAPQIIAAFGKLLDAKLTYMQIGFLTSLPSCCAVFIGYFWARHSDSTGERVWHAAFGAIGAGAGLVLLANSSTFTMLFVGLVLLGGCIAGGAAAIWQLPTRGMSDRWAAVAFAFVNSVAVIFSSIIPYVIGYLTDRTGSYMAALYLIGGIMALAAILVVVGGTVFERRGAVVTAAAPVGESD